MGGKVWGMPPKKKNQDKRFNNDVYMYICLFFEMWGTDYDTVFYSHTVI